MISDFFLNTQPWVGGVLKEKKRFLFTYFRCRWKENLGDFFELLPCKL